MPRARFVKQIEQSPNHGCLIFSLHTGGLSLVPALHSKSVVHVWSPHVPAQAGTGSSLHFWAQSKGQYVEMYTCYCWAIVMVSFMLRTIGRALCWSSWRNWTQWGWPRRWSTWWTPWPTWPGLKTVNVSLVTCHMSHEVPCQIFDLSGLASLCWGVLCLRTWKWPRKLTILEWGKEK